MSTADTSTIAGGAAPITVRHSGIADWLTTVDHKQIGIAYLFTAGLFATVAAVAAVIWRIELFSPGLQIVNQTNDAQVVTLMLSSAFFLFLLPGFLGLAVYLVPLQIGATKVAMPRMQALAYWLFFGGAVLVAVSYAVKGGPYAAKALIDVPAASQGGQSSMLWIFGMATVAVAAVIAAIGLVTTIVTERAPGLTFDRLPVFTWSTMVTSLVAILSVPVFLVGLELHGISLRGDGRFFTAKTAGDLWAHVLWLHGLPFVLALLVMGGGVISEVVPTFARRGLISYRPALFLLGATAALTFLVWADDRTSARAPLAPTFSVPAALFVAPLGALMLMWLVTILTGRPRPGAALAHAFGFVVSVGLSLVGLVSAVSVPVKGGTAWAEGHLGFLVFAPCAFALSAGLYYWAPKMWGRYLNEGLGYLHFLFLLGGSILAFGPSYTGLRDFPRWAFDTSGNFTAYNRIASLGYFVLVLGFLLFVVNLVGSVWLKRGRLAPADAWGEGATLEWLADSPPAAQNFVNIPPIRSEHPVLDMRTAMTQRDA